MNFEKLNEANCRISDIRNNDKILVGGSFSGALDLAVTADIDNFEKFFKTVEKNASNFQNNENMKKWLNSFVPDFDAGTFSHMWAFDNVLRRMYPNLSSDISNRNSFYDKEGSQSLSQSFEAGICACAEIAILAQSYFQKQGIETKYFGGELLRSPNDESGEPHSFITIKTEKDDYIYDPANPMLDSGMYLPRISTIEATPAQKKQFENKIHTEDSSRRNCAFLEAKNIITKHSLYYGCGDGGEFMSPSFIISKNNIQTPYIKEHGR